MSISVSGWRRVPEDVRKLCFDLWVEHGSLTVAAKRLEDLGYVNSNGKPYAVFQVGVQANTYLLDNFKKLNLIDDINKDRERFGYGPLDQTAFEEYIVSRAVSVWGRRKHVTRFWNWIEAHDFWKYKNLWESYNIRPRPSNQPHGSASEGSVAEGVSE